MSGQTAELNEVKSIIRGLLISSTTKMTVHQLDADYRKQEGCSIPFRKLGYISIEEFLYSIPDTVNLREPRSGCPYHMFIVEPVQSKKSNHVEKMVIHQKNSSKTIRGMKRTPAIRAPPVQKRIEKPPKLNGMAPRFVPMKLRIALSHVCERYAQAGLPLSSLGDELSQNLNAAGLSKKGHFKWLNDHGFMNMEELIDSFIDQDLIQVISRNGKEWIIPSIKNEISKHKTSEVVSNDTNRKVISDSCSSYKAETFPASSNHYLDNGRLPVSPAGAESPEGSYEDDWTPMISDKMKANFRTILRKYPDGLWCSSLPFEYYKLTRSELEIKQLGFISMIQMASKLKDVFICTRPDSNSDWLLFDATSNSIWNTPASPVCKERKLAIVPSHVIKNIESLLAVSRQGIKKHQFLEVYKETFEEELPMADFGFENIMALLAHLANRGIVHLKFVGSDPMVCRPIKNVSNGFSLKDLKQEDDFIDALYPNGVMTPKDDIPFQTLPEYLVPGSSMDVLVTEVVTPSLFWFQIWTPDLQGEMDSLMDELQVVYSSNKYKMPDGAIQIGQYCATLYPPPPTSVVTEWHRALIIALPSPTEAEVLYVDYGTKAIVLRSNLHFLDLKYSKLPIQRFKAGLYHIRPIGYGILQKSGAPLPTWSKEATNTFLKMVTNRPVVAVIAKIRETPDVFLNVVLTDTTSEDTDKHINDVLVAIKLAELGHMADDEDQKEKVMSVSPVGERSRSATSETFYEEEEESSWQDLENPILRPLPPGVTLSTPRLAPAESEIYGKVSNQSFPLLPYAESSPRGSVHTSRESSMEPQASVESAMQGNILNQSLPSKPPVNSPPGGNVFPARQMSKQLQNPGVSIASNHPCNPSVSYLQSPQNENLNPAKDVNMQPLLQCLTGLELRQQHELLRLIEELRILTETSRKELESLKMYQQKLHLEELISKIRFLSMQNCMFPTVPPGLNPSRMNQVVPPPPGMANVNPFGNMAASYDDIVARAIQNNNNPFIPCNNVFPPVPLPPYSNPSLGDFAANYFSPQLFGANCFNQGVSPSAKTYTPPGFENSIPPVKINNAWQQQYVNPSPIPQESFYKGANVPCNPVIKPEEPTPEIVNTVPVTRGLNKDVVVNSGVQRSFSENNVDSSNLNTSSVRSSDILPCSLSENVSQGSFSKTKMCSLKSSSGEIDTSENKPNPKKCDSFADLHSSFEACSLNSCKDEGISFSVVNNTVEKDRPKKMKAERNTQNVITIIVDPESAEEDKPDICKGTVNGVIVNVVKIDGSQYVLTEEILALFFHNLPVHVATRIINIRPGGKNIVFTSINARKDRDIWKQIERLGTIEMNPRGSDVHLTSVKTLHSLFCCLDQPL